MRILLFIFLACLPAFPQTIREYTVNRTSAALKIDGQLTEPDWRAAPRTERFVWYTDGAATRLNTQAKMLWDDAYLYIGFICEDPDVWGTFKNRDDYLWNGEVVEILCDPDGDGLNYFEVQVNPLGTLLDLFLNRAYSMGGKANLAWNLDSLRAGVWVDGTLNNLSDVDSQWTCEVALPFAELAFMAPTKNFPPQPSDQWRILVTRYDYERTGAKVVEISSWNKTDSRGFHVPEKFGRITFSGETGASVPKGSANTPEHFRLQQNYPNPFNPATTILFEIAQPAYVSLKIFDLAGREIVTLLNAELTAGSYHAVWHGTDGFQNPVAAGIYFMRMEVGGEREVRKVVVVR